MICHTLQRLSFFSSLENYQYVGLGAFFFYDFILLHKELNIKSMYSIQSVKDVDFHSDGTYDFIDDAELEERRKKRYLNNKPFDCVKMHFDITSNALLGVDFDRKLIIWLDYDNKFNSIMSSDIRWIASKISSGSVFFISCNAAMPNRFKPREEFYKFSELVGHDLVSAAGVSEKTFSNKNGRIVAAKLIFDTIIDSALDHRNRSIAEDDQIKYKQLYYFSYKDGQQMVTIGGIFFSKKHEELCNNCNFQHFDFLALDRSSLKPFEILIPNLTIKETKELNMRMPNIASEFDPQKEFGILEEDILAFSQIYRYMPLYSELFI
jgi:hypothetical protein